MRPDLVVMHCERGSIAVDPDPVGRGGHELADAAPLLMQTLQLAHYFVFQAVQVDELGRNWGVHRVNLPFFPSVGKKG